MIDEDFMRRAIQLAASQVGRTGENPAVGCVIARDGVVVGEGATGDGGRPHGEEIALARAAEQARGATAYVTLEPCAQRSAGGTSCTDRLIAAGILRVVSACGDSSVFADGHGARRLQAAGVITDQGLLSAEAAPLYAAYVPKKPLESRR